MKKFSGLIVTGVLASSIALIAGCSSNAETTQGLETASQTTVQTEEATTDQAPEQPAGSRMGMFGDLDEETRAKAEEIMSAMRDGNITREEAEAQLAELGVEMQSMPEMPATSETSEDATL